MKELFHIEEPGSVGREGLLSIRIGENHVGFAFTDREGKKLKELAYYNFEEWDADVENQLISLQAAENKVIVCYDFPGAILIGNADMPMDDASTILPQLGKYNAGSVILSDDLAAQKLLNIFAVPARIHEWVKAKFPGAEFIHDYSVAIKTNRIEEASAEIYVDFRTSDFTSVIWKERKLIQAGSFSYQTPADVLFYLLRICESWSLSQTTTQLTLSGFVDRQSTMFTELFQYFLPVSFTETGWTTSSAYPPHFFGSFQNLATCAL